MRKLCSICGQHFNATNKRQHVCPTTNCRKEHNKRAAKAWRANNREWVKERSRAYNVKYVEKNRARAKRWNETHQEWVRLRAKLERWEQRTLADAMRAILDSERK